ncbi:MAG: hypothetical protein JKY54_06780 [Flavobacteriales bacterium]|nr:hypothetical protein [Flavobacteriales bacterium]
MTYLGQEISQDAVSNSFPILKIDQIQNTAQEVKLDLSIPSVIKTTNTIETTGSIVAGSIASSNVITDITKTNFITDKVNNLIKQIDGIDFDIYKQIRMNNVSISGASSMDATITKTTQIQNSSNVNHLYLEGTKCMFQKPVDMNSNPITNVTFLNQSKIIFTHEWFLRVNGGSWNHVVVHPTGKLFWIISHNIQSKPAHNVTVGWDMHQDASRMNKNEISVDFALGWLSTLSDVKSICICVEL